MAGWGVEEWMRLCVDACGCVRMRADARGRMGPGGACGWLRVGAGGSGFLRANLGGAGGCGWVIVGARRPHGGAWVRVGIRGHAWGCGRVRARAGACGQPEDLDWPAGAMVNQACHACTAVTWEAKEDPEAVEYFTEAEGQMTTVTMGAADPSSIR